jgi:hypothetical protein
MRVLVCGSRDLGREWLKKIRDRLEKLPPDTVIVEGGARGADLLARTAALDTGLNVIEIPANWRKYGPSAGPIRNRQMLDLAPGLVIAFHPNVEESKGTKDCVGQAKRRGISVEIIT